MSKCKKIRAVMEDDYKSAANLGISKKLLKVIVKERELERKIAGLTDGFEPDQQSEMDMLKEKLGEFANTPVQMPAKAVSGLSSLSANQTTSFFLVSRVRLRRVLCEAVERHQAAGLRLQPAAPVGWFSSVIRVTVAARALRHGGRISDGWSALAWMRMMQ